VALEKRGLLEAKEVIEIMKKLEVVFGSGFKGLGTALLVDVVSAAPLLGNVVRVLLADDLGVDLIDPKDKDDALWAMGTIASFIPVATILTIKERVKQK